MPDLTKGTARKAAEAHRQGLNPLGDTGLWCHPLGFGCYRIDEGEPEHEAALRTYLDRGGNLIDTSANYTDGGSERTVGKVLRRYDRGKVIVVTKGGYIQGENMALAQRSNFPEVVKYGPGLWHCIHPDFLKTQIERSRRRMGLDTIDVFLLHNPEYFINHQAKKNLTEADRDEFYRRVQTAFAYLESEVAAGRIGCYGISSNNYPLPLSDPTHTSIARCWEQAERLTANHHFKVVQFPLNVYESGVALEPSNLGQTPLEFCRAKGIGTLANRPFNAFHRNALIRLADFVLPGRPKPGPDTLEPHLKRIEDLERRLRDHLRIEPMHRRGIAAYLRDMLPQIRSMAVWEQVAGQYVIYPIRGWLSSVLQEVGDDPIFEQWQNEFLDEINPLLAQIGKYASAQGQVNSDRVRKKLVDAGYPERREVPLSQIALNLLESLDGLSCTLVGMRRPEYVADAFQGLDLPKVAATDILGTFRTIG